ncbi:MAG TPA: protein kinase [Labilithrix sp.]|nr:protein kinase [Labilithrix sp.]
MNIDDSHRIGSTLRDKWVLEELLGVGGMASVYAARHKIGRREAIKILHAKVARSEQLRARFEQEAHAVNAFRHPGVVEIRDVDTAEDGAPFLVMELLEGETLAQRLAREHSVASREMLQIAAQVLDVLAAAHSRAIIHRDIKPDNLFLTKDGKVKVLDFGIARVRSADRKALTTKAGVTLGTMAYMAPEQARGEEIDGRADIYAVGATMFRSLAGRIVHDDDSQAALVLRVIAHGAPRLRTVIPDVEPDVAAVVDRALAFELVDRYPDASAMLSDVQAVLDGRLPPYASTAPPIPERPRVSSLFDETPNDVKIKPTMVPAARKAQRAPEPAEATRVGEIGIDAMPPTISGGGWIPAEALPSVKPSSVPTRISREESLPSGAVPSTPLSDRVVIVPSRQGEAVRVEAAGDPSHRSPPGAGTSDVATVYGLAPPPVASPPFVIQPPRPQAATSGAVLTPFGELSAFIRKGPSMTVLVIGGSAVVLAFLLMIVAIIWFVSGSKTEAAEPSTLPTSATAERTLTPEPPPPQPTTRRSRR